MTTTVTSKFRNSLWTAPVFLVILIFILVTIIVYLVDQDYSQSNAHEIMATLAILIGIICFNAYSAVTRFIKVTVTPDALLLHYLLTGKQRAVDYESIAHIALVRDYSGDGSSLRYSLINLVKLKIVLNTDDIFYLYEEYYQNFEELKEAIRRARFKLE
jgi:hypothetical protein